MLPDFGQLRDVQPVQKPGALGSVCQAKVVGELMMAHLAIYTSLALV